MSEFRIVGNSVEIDIEVNGCSAMVVQDGGAWHINFSDEHGGGTNYLAGKRTSFPEVLKRAFIFVSSMTKVFGPEV